MLVSEAIDETIIAQVVERFRMETERLGGWAALREACTLATGATACDVYLYEGHKRRLRRIEHTLGQGTDRPLRLSASMPTTADHVAARAVRTGTVADCFGPDAQYE